MKDGFHGLPDLWIFSSCELSTCDKNKVVTREMIHPYFHDAGPYLPFDSISPDGVGQLFADRYPDPEISRVIPPIKKRKTVG